MLKKIIKSSLAIVVAFSLGFSFVHHQAFAEEKIDGKCSITIDASKHTGEDNKRAIATGMCGKRVTGYYAGGHFTVTGGYDGDVVDGEKYNVTIMPGFYTYEVTVHTIGSLKKAENKSKTAKVKYKAPKVITVKTTSTSVKGTTVAGAKVTVKAGTKILGKSIANKKGYYEVKIKKQKAGTKLTVSAIKGNDMSATTIVTVKK